MFLLTLLDPLCKPMEASRVCDNVSASDSDISFAGDSSDSCPFAINSSSDDLCENSGNVPSYSFSLPYLLANNKNRSSPNLNLCNTPEVECSRLCKGKCHQNVQSWSTEMITDLKKLFSGNNQCKKNKMLSQLAFQCSAGLPINGFFFHGQLLCNNYFSHVSNISKHHIRTVIKDFSHGKKMYVHGNCRRKRINGAKVNFIAWMKLTSEKYGQDGPTDIVTILPHYLNRSVLFKMYLDEAPKPHLKRSSFYRLFKKEFGPRRENKDLPWIREASFIHSIQYLISIEYVLLIYPVSVYYL